MFGLMDEIEVGFREHEAAMAALLVKVAEYDRSGEWSMDGFLSAAAALRARCRMNVGVAPTTSGTGSTAAPPTSTP